MTTMTRTTTARAVGRIVANPHAVISPQCRAARWPEDREYPDCQVSGCPRKAEVAGDCRRHYTQRRRTGNPLTRRELGTQ